MTKSRGAGRYRIITTSLAESDLRDIWMYIAADSVVHADRVIQRLVESVDGLAIMPRRHPAAPESKRLRGDVRHAIVWPYRVVFEVRSDYVVVHTVRHGGRRPWPGPIVE